MLKDEHKAPYDYRRLKAQIKNKTDKRVIAGIIRDEQSHYRKVKKMLKGGRK